MSVHGDVSQNALYHEPLHNITTFCTTIPLAYACANIIPVFNAEGSRFRPTAFRLISIMLTETKV
eukprot:6392979-Amphidinium_carterae.2